MNPAPADKLDQRELLISVQGAASWVCGASCIRGAGRWARCNSAGVAAMATAPFSLILSGVMVIAGAVFFGVQRPTKRLIDLREAAMAEAAEQLP